MPLRKNFAKPDFSDHDMRDADGQHAVGIEDYKDGSNMQIESSRNKYATIGGGVGLCVQQDLDHPR